MRYCSSSFTQGYQSQEQFGAQQPLKGKMLQNPHDKHDRGGSSFLKDAIARAVFSRGWGLMPGGVSGWPNILSDVTSPAPRLLPTKHVFMLVEQV